MPFPRSASPFLLCLCLAMAAPLPASVTIRKAVFSDRQLFWPALAGQGRPANAHAAQAQTPHPAAERGKGGDQGAAKGSVGDGARLAVLPIAVKEYSETRPCDSCHRLSPNGLEFFLENYLRARMEARFPGQHVELVAPTDPLVEKRFNLMGYLDSLRLPWARWLPDSGEAVIYRPGDRFTDPGTRRRLDRLGGILGATHLLIPVRVHARVDPVASNTHTGGLDWGFSLALWNVAAGSPEWALVYRESETAMDLDESLEGRLDRALGSLWENLPAELQAQWAAEPK